MTSKSMAEGAPEGARVAAGAQTRGAGAHPVCGARAGSLGGLRAQEQTYTKSRKRIASDRKSTDAGADVCAVDEADGPAEICDELDDDLVDGQVEDEDLVDVGAELEPDGEFCRDAEPRL